MPPLHPRCRCAIIYRETSNGNVSGAIKPLTSARCNEIRSAQEAAYNAETGADFGFKKMRGSPDWSKEIRLANAGKGLEYMLNCQRCVVAHEARMRGYDVIARPSWGKDDPLQKVGNWLEVFAKDGREIYNCAGNNAAELEKFIETKMKEWGKGSRAFVWFDWKESAVSLGRGHVIVTRLNENGYVQFGDPQTGEIGAVRCLKAAKPGSVLIMRADNLKFTNEIKCCCMNRR